MFRTVTQRNRRHRDWLTVSIVLGALLLLYFLIPLVALLTAQPLGHVLGKLSDPAIVAAARMSFATATVSTIIATIFGVPLAFWLARTQNRFRTLAMAVVVLPLVLPPIVSGMVVLTVVGPETLIGRVAAAAGLSLTRSFAGVVLAQLFVASPFVVVTATAAFASINQELEYASRSLGKSRLVTLRRVTLPLAWPGILAGMTLMFARAIGEFGATMMLAYYPRTMPVQIWISYTTLGLENAFPVAVVLLVIAACVIVLLNVLRTNPWA